MSNNKALRLFQDIKMLLDDVGDCKNYSLPDIAVEAFSDGITKNLIFHDVNANYFINFLYDLDSEPSSKLDNNPNISLTIAERMKIVIFKEKFLKDLKNELTNESTNNNENENEYKAVLKNIEEQEKKLKRYFNENKQNFINECENNVRVLKNQDGNSLTENTLKFNSAKQASDIARMEYIVVANNRKKSINKINQLQVQLSKSVNESEKDKIKIEIEKTDKDSKTACLTAINNYNSKKRETANASYMMGANGHIFYQSMEADMLDAIGVAPDAFDAMKTIVDSLGRNIYTMLEGDNGVNFQRESIPSKMLMGASNIDDFSTHLKILSDSGCFTAKDCLARQKSDGNPFDNYPTQIEDYFSVFDEFIPISSITNRAMAPELLTDEIIRPDLRVSATILQTICGRLFSFELEKDLKNTDKIEEAYKSFSTILKDVTAYIEQLNINVKSNSIDDASRARSEIKKLNCILNDIIINGAVDRNGRCLERKQMTSIGDFIKILSEKKEDPIKQIANDFLKVCNYNKDIDTSVPTVTLLSTNRLLGREKVIIDGVDKKFEINNHTLIGIELNRLANKGEKPQIFSSLQDLEKANPYKLIRDRNIEQWISRGNDKKIYSLFDEKFYSKLKDDSQKVSVASMIFCLEGAKRLYEEETNDIKKQEANKRDYASLLQIVTKRMNEPQKYVSGPVREDLKNKLINDHVSPIVNDMLHFLDKSKRNYMEGIFNNSKKDHYLLSLRNITKKINEQKYVNFIGDDLKNKLIEEHISFAVGDYNTPKSTSDFLKEESSKMNNKEKTKNLATIYSNVDSYRRYISDFHTETAFKDYSKKLKEGVKEIKTLNDKYNSIKDEIGKTVKNINAFTSLSQRRELDKQREKHDKLNEQLLSMINRIREAGDKIKNLTIAHEKAVKDINDEINEYRDTLLANKDNKESIIKIINQHKNNNIKFKNYEKKFSNNIFSKNANFKSANESIKSAEKIMTENASVFEKASRIAGLDSKELDNKFESLIKGKRTMNDGIITK
jgi:hypothetical protein